MATTTLRVGPERWRNGLVSVPHWEALCLASYEKLLCLLLLIFSGLRPSQWQKEPLHNAVPSAKELRRGCVALLHGKTTVSKLKERSPSAGSRVCSAARTKRRGYKNVFACWKRLFFLYFFSRAGCAETTVNTLWTLFYLKCHETLLIVALSAREVFVFLFPSSVFNVAAFHMFWHAWYIFLCN